MNALTIDIPGVDIFTRITGEPTNPAVLCLHSLFLNGAMFDAWAKHVSDHLFVIAPDFRGQGSSPNQDSHDILGMDLYAEDMIQVLNRISEIFKIDRLGILAQSMGGDVALRLTHNRPDLVSSIALLGSSACAEPVGQLQEFREWVDGVENSGFTGETLQYTLEVMLGVSCRIDSARSEVVRKMTTELSQLDKGLLPAMRGVVERSSALDLLPEIAVPVLIISGLEDWARPPEWSLQMHNLLPQSQLLQLENVGHSPIVEVPELIFDELQLFFISNA